MPPLPAPPELVAAYLLELAEERGRSVATIRLHKTALAAVHKAAVHEDPTLHTGLMKWKEWFGSRSAIPVLLLVMRVNLSQVQLIRHGGDKVRQLVFEQPLLESRRQQQSVVGAIVKVGLAHQRLHTLYAGHIIPALTVR